MSRQPTERQLMVLSFIHSYIQAHSYPPTIREIATQLGIRSTNGVSRHLEALEHLGCIVRGNGARSIRIADEAGAALEANEDRARDETSLLAADSIRLVPLVGTVAAGVPITAVEHIEEHIPLNTEFFRCSEQSFLLRVRGDSMAPGISPDDLVLVSPQIRPERSDIVVALIEDEATVKRFYPEKDRLILRADNPSYADIIASRDISILGKVTGLIRHYS